MDDLKPLCSLDFSLCELNYQDRGRTMREESKLNVNEDWPQRPCQALKRGDLPT